MCVDPKGSIRQKSNCTVHTPTRWNFVFTLCSWRRLFVSCGLGYGDMVLSKYETIQRSQRPTNANTWIMCQVVRNTHISSSSYYYWRCVNNPISDITLHCSAPPSTLYHFHNQLYVPNQWTIKDIATDRWLWMDMRSSCASCITSLSSRTIDLLSTHEDNERTNHACNEIAI